MAALMPTPNPFAGLELLSTASSMVANQNTEEFVGYYIVHITAGHWILILAASVDATKFENIGVSVLIRDLRRGRRPLPPVLSPIGRGCRCRGCAYPKCGGAGEEKTCLKIRRSRNFCYGCSPYYAEGCEYNYTASPNGQWCPRGHQAMDVVGRRLCWAHSEQSGLHLGKTLQDALEDFPPNQPILLMTETKPSSPFNPNQPSITTVRYRGYGNGETLVMTDMLDRKLAYQLHYITDTLRPMMGDDQQWIQKVAIKFLRDDPVIYILGERRYST